MLELYLENKIHLCTVCISDMCVYCSAVIHIQEVSSYSALSAGRQNVISFTRIAFSRVHTSDRMLMS